MPKKLQFQVVHVSGHESGHGPKELEIHSPVTKGWQSQKFCVYPQELVLKLYEPASLKKLQILSHQYLVASKVEIFAALPSNSKSPSLYSCKFKRLGYISLSTNESSNFKTRELKSVNLNVECQFVKFLIHKNHVNEHNLYNQVNVIAINLIGEPIDDIYTETKKTDVPTIGAEDLVQQFMSGGDVSELRKDILRGSRPDYISPLDDLAFDIYQDAETAQLIRRLEVKKQDAVLEERFDYAKKLKQAMADLQKVGEKLGRFEVEKRRAIEIEDYDLAKAKKLQADEYRLHVYKQLDLPDLLEIKQVEPLRQQQPIFTTSQIHSKQSQQQQQHLQSVQSNSTTQKQKGFSNEPKKPTKTESPVLPPIRQSGVTSLVQVSTIESETNLVTNLPKTPELGTPRHSPKPLNPEDRPIPALKSKGALEDKLEFSNEETPQSDEKPNELSEKDETEASPIIDVYGLFLVQLAYSKVWKHRQESMESVIKEITTDQGKLTFESDPKAIVKATAMLLKRMLNDNVITVFSEAVKVENSLLTEYIPGKKLGKSEYAFVVDKTIPVLLTRTGDLTPRTKDSAITLICDIAVLKEIKALGTVPDMLVQPIKSKGQAPWRLFKGRLEVIHKLLEPLDVDKQGSFTTDGVMQFVKKAIEHSHKDVREAGIMLLFDMYKKVGNAVRKYLPADEPATRKNPLYGRIFDGLDKIDGKPTKAEQKLLAKQEKQDADKAKKDQIAALQAQLKELKALKDAADEKTGDKAGGPSVGGDLVSQDSVNIDNLCIFCGEFNEKESQESLDSHYAKSCPMLKKCTNCSQVIEICNLNEHLLTECEKKSDFKKCPRCQEAILKTQLDDHVKAKTCPATRADKHFNRCPLCKEKVPDGEEGWKKHLMHDCKANMKRLQQQKKVGKAEGKPPPDKKRPAQKSAGVVKRRTSKMPEKAGKPSEVK